MGDGRDVSGKRERKKDARFTDRSAEAEETTAGRAVGIGLGIWGRRRGKGGCGTRPSNKKKYQRFLMEERGRGGGLNMAEW